MRSRTARILLLAAFLDLGAALAVGACGSGGTSSPPLADGASPQDAAVDASTSSEASSDAAPHSATDASGGPELVIDLTDEEQLGPFPSWKNVKTDFGAAGDGTTDDTAAIQSALASLCVVDQPMTTDAGRCNFVLYFPAGTYLITSTLTMELNYGAALVGEDPTTTSLAWGGSAGGTMLITSGSSRTLFSRLTWDGRSTAAIGVAQWWNYTIDRQNYQGGIKHVDEVFQDLGIAIFGGRLGPDYGQGDSEVTIRRTQFLRESQAGVNVGSFNALDWWIWDSLFTDCARGVTNDFSFTGPVGAADAGPTSGAGNFMIYRSVFQRSTVADMEIGNTGWFSLHDNVSIDSQQFIHAKPIGDNACGIIAENNRVVDTVDPVSVRVGNAGPLILVDNAIRSAPSDAGDAGPVVLLDDTIGVVDRNVLSLGNQYTVASPIAIVPNPGAQDRMLSIGDQTVPRAAIATPTAVTPPIAQNYHRTVIEVPAGASADAIQQAIGIAAAGDAGTNPVVHLPGGTYDLDHALTIPAGARLQLAGDGDGTVLNWNSTASPAGPMLSLAGPSLATIRDLKLLASAATGIDLGQADQPGGRVFLDGTLLISPATLTDLAQTRVELQTSQFEGIAVSGSQSVMSMGGTIGTTPIEVSGSSQVLVSDHWYEGDTSNLFRGSSGTFTYMGGEIAPYSHGIRPEAGLSPTSPSVLVDGFSGSVSFIVPGFDLITGQAQAANGILVEEAGPATSAMFFGASANRSDFFTVMGDGGAVGLVFSKGVDDAGHSTDLPDFGRADPAFITAGFAQVRSIVWQTVPFVATPGSADVRILRVAINTAIRGAANGLQVHR